MTPMDASSTSVSSEASPSVLYSPSLFNSPVEAVPELAEFRAAPPAATPAPIEQFNWWGGENTVSLTLTAFDEQQYLQLIQARGETIRRVVAELKPLLRLANAVDAGCGVGFFSQTLADCGLYVRGFDGRLENVVEARRRFPRIPFGQWDVEDPEITRLGTFDLVLCFGLLYHLENPMLAIRHLRALTGKGLLLESMCVPGDAPGMMLRDEPRQEDQSLTDIALYPSEGCLVKMLYRAGFAAVYRVAAMPDHEDFRETTEHARRRTVLFASVAPVTASGLREIREPRERRDPWERKSGGAGTGAVGLPRRIGRFLRRPARMKYISLAQRARAVFPEMPIPLRLPFGAWWLAEKGALDHELVYNVFEAVETAFVGRFLQPGMTVLDIGAHHGLYTLLASKRVGREGRVIAFEPSLRERRRLLRHIRINGCWNVSQSPSSTALPESRLAIAPYFRGTAGLGGSCWRGGLVSGGGPAGLVQQFAAASGG